MMTDLQEAHERFIDETSILQRQPKFYYNDGEIGIEI